MLQSAKRSVNCRAWPVRAMQSIETLEHFKTYGWRRIPAVFSAADAAAMCDVIWAALAKVGIQRDEPATWTTARQVNLQHLRINQF